MPGSEHDNERRPQSSGITELLQRWLALRVVGSAEEAQRLHAEVVKRVGPADFDALHQLAVDRAMSGDAAAAVELLDLALRVGPASAPAYCHRGNALYALARIDEALESYERALELEPGHAMTLSNRGVALHELKRYREAADSYDAALRIDPGQSAVLYNRGNALQMLGRGEEALESYDRSLALAPGHVNALTNRGQTLHVLRRYAEALRSYDQAIALAAQAPVALNNRGNLLREMGELDAAIESHLTYLALRPNDAFGHSVLIYTLLCARADAREVDAQCRTFEERFGGQSVRLPHANPRVPDRKLRVGYVSADFREHPVAYHLEPILENHGEDFEVYGYCDHDRGDALTDRLSSLCGHWRAVSGFSDDDLAAAVQQDGIDILVDLAGHTTRNRLPMFARKPAPVQITWLGLPATTGLSAIDYRLTDDHVDPPGLTEPHHSERLVALSSHACYRPPPLPAVNRLPMLGRGYVTFGSFNRIDKITPQTYALWTAVLAAVPRSRLLMVCDAALFGIVEERFAGLGMAADRLIFVRTAPLPDYLRWHHMVDIALDTFPFNGGTVTRNALWMGLPVITLAGTVSVSRVGLALMTQIGLPDFVATTPEQYVEIAKRWSADSDGLASIRATLRERMQGAALSDGAGYTRALERVYRRMWQAWCEQDSPVRIVRR